MKLRWVLAIALFLTACRTAQPRIIAYVFGDADLHRVGATKLTHINYAFGLVSPDGVIVLENPHAPARLAQLQALKAKNPRLKIILSVGGWGADNFSDAALTGASREKFAASAIDIIKRYALDGIDLDWEYPGQPGPGIKYRAEDKQNFTLMLRALRGQLETLSDARGLTGQDRYTLSIASSAGPYFVHTEMDRLHEYLDWINIMTYDFAGSWTPVTGHHAALYWNRAAGEDGPSAASFVRQHLEAGIPRHKIVLGVPFYGRGWTGVNPDNHGFHQPYENAVEYSWSRLQSEKGFERHWDDVAKAPFLWNPETSTFVSYEDRESLRVKAQFIRKERLGGFMFWEYAHDPHEELLNALVEGVRKPAPSGR
jgi:chitinase